MLRLKKTYNPLKLLIIILAITFTNTLYSQQVRVIDNKGTIDIVNNNNVTVGTTVPTTPLEGDVWFDTLNNEIKIYDTEPLFAPVWRNMSGYYTDNIYNINGTLSDNRDLNGNGKNLRFYGLGSFHLYDTNDIQLISNAYIQITAPSGILLYSNITAYKNFWLKEQFKDSSGDSGTANQILSSIGTGTNWIDNPAAGPTSGTTGSVFFAGAAGVLTENNSQLFWDNTNNRLRIGSALSGTNKLSVQGVVRSQGYNNSNGTVNLPSYRFSSDSNTGMYRIGANQLGFTTDGINALSIDATQNISIPKNLAVTGTYADSSNDVGTANQLLSSTGTGTSWIDYPLSNNWSLLGNTGINPLINFLGTTDAQPLVFKTNNIEKLKIHETKGQVLINQAPTFNNHPLVIRASGVDVLAFQDAAGTPKWHWNLLANGLNFVESNVLDYRLFLENGGDIGINTNNPTERLDINGRLKIRTIDAGDLTIDKLIVADANGVIKKIDLKFHTVGDIKNGIQPADHSGWYVLNGRAVAGLSAAAQAAAASLGLATNLPDATNRVLKHPNGGEVIGDIGGATTTTLSQNNLPNYNLPQATTNTNGDHNHTYPNTLADNRVQHNGDGFLNFYSNTGNSNTNSTGNHNHTVTVSSGGNDEAFERYQPYLVVNTFIYLGL